MKRIILTFAIISFLSFAQLVAQVGAPYVSINFYGTSNVSSLDTSASVPVRNTLNNLIGVFYQDEDYVMHKGGYYFSTVDSTGHKTVNFGLASYSTAQTIVIDAAWHPQSECYLVVYLLNKSAFYGRIVKFYPGSNRPIALAQKYIAKYTLGSRIRVAPAKNGKFIVFINNGQNLSAKSLNDDATTFRPLKTLTNYSHGELYLGGAEKDGRLTAAYILFRPVIGRTAYLRMVKVNNKLTKVKIYKVTSLPKPGQYFAFLGTYDPVNHIHTAIVGEKYCTFKRKGKIKFGLANLPTAEPARDIAYDPVNQCFVLMTVGFYITTNPNTEGGNIYLSTYDYNGTFLTPETFLLDASTSYGEPSPSTFKVEYAPNGFYLITYGFEKLGFKGAYFN